jgi:hypothetical protein
VFLSTCIHSSGSSNFYLRSEAANKPPTDSRVWILGFKVGCRALCIWVPLGTRWIKICRTITYQNLPGHGRSFLCSQQPPSLNVRCIEIKVVLDGCQTPCQVTSKAILKCLCDGCLCIGGNIVGRRLSLDLYCRGRVGTGGRIGTVQCS